MKNIIIIIGGCLGVIVIGLLIYFIQIENKKNASLEPSRGYFEALKEKKEVVSSNDEEETGDRSSNECEKDGRVYFDIPELGISVLVDEKVKDDLVYSSSRGYGDGGIISSKKLIEMDLDGSCSVDNMKGTGVFGVFGVFKLSEDYPEPDVSLEMLIEHVIKKFNLNPVGTKKIGKSVFIFDKRSYKCSSLDYEDYFIENSLDVIIEEGNVNCIKEIEE